MTDNDDIDFRSAQRELNDAVLRLCKITGEPAPEPAAGAPQYCSFCGKGINQVHKLVAGPSVHICDKCVAQAQE